MLFIFFNGPDMQTSIRPPDSDWLPSDMDVSYVRSDAKPLPTVQKLIINLFLFILNCSIEFFFKPMAVDENDF